jgi:hypothetical protein
LFSVSHFSVAVQDGQGANIFGTLTQYGITDEIVGDKNIVNFTLQPIQQFGYLLKTGTYAAQEGIR